MKYCKISFVSFLGIILLSTTALASTKGSDMKDMGSDYEVKGSVMEKKGSDLTVTEAEAVAVTGNIGFSDVDEQECAAILETEDQITMSSQFFYSSFKKY